MASEGWVRTINAIENSIHISFLCLGGKIDAKKQTDNNMNMAIKSHKCSESEQEMVDFWVPQQKSKWSSNSARYAVLE